VGVIIHRAGDSDPNNLELFNGWWESEDAARGSFVKTVIDKGGVVKQIAIFDITDNAERPA